MIEIIKADIFGVPSDGLIHQCNCFHTMGTGIAKQIKTRFPEAYAADLLTRKGDENKLGSFSYAPVKNQHYAHIKKIINLYGQFKYGRDTRYTSYDALAHGLDLIMRVGWEWKNTTLTLPYKMGCNNAGGNWNIVFSIVESVFKDDPNFRVLICEIP